MNIIISCRFTFCLSAIILASSAQLHAESTAPIDGDKTPAHNIDYTYQHNHGLDFSAIKSGPLFINTLTDNRNCEPHQFCNDSGSQLDAAKPIGATLSHAIAQAFTQGDATLATTSADLNLRGELLKAALETSTADAQLVSAHLKIKLQLVKADKVIWENTLLAKSRPVNRNNVSQAIHGAFDTLIEELFYDDYFVMELID